MLNPIASIVSPTWVIFFGYIYFKEEVWAVASQLATELLASAIICIFILCFLVAVFWGLPRGVDSKDTTKLWKQEDDSGLRPLIFPSRTTHVRLFPKKHSFSYSYLLIGVPIGWRGSVDSFLSVDVPSQSSLHQSTWRRAWFTLSAADYLERGGEDLDLKGKLQSYLKTQSEDVDNYACAYLITAPRFLGYSFNPVSFWYLYNKQKQLKAMILEVNNTFDERRMYLLKDLPTSIEKSEDPTSSDPAPKIFKNVWSKDFHVSPFNSRKGSYALTAHDPFNPHFSSTESMVDNTIVLSSSKDHAKLVARIFSTQPGINPAMLGYWARLRFIAAWWWVGFVTSPRIVKEAGKLFFRRKLHVWYRPEVTKNSVGRHATEDE
ncbi:MAG: hypothetical protein Q9218_000228, partial [Villophora microphyllina]